MRIKKQRRDNVLILTLLESRLDANNAPHFKSEIQHLVNSDIRGLVINIANLEFIDSTGLGAIVKGLKLMDRRAAVAVCGARDPILTMFKLTRMDKVMHIYDSEAEALDFIHTNLVFA